jgi:hypothetical protein
MTAEPEPAPPGRECPHCGHHPDSVVVVKRVTYYERHSPDCPAIGEVAGRSKTPQQRKDTDMSNTDDNEEMTPEEYTLSLVPNVTDMTRVGLFIVAECQLNLEGTLNLYREAAEDNPARAFQMMVGLAETVVQKLHLREDPEAYDALVKDLGLYADRADNEHDEKDDNQEGEN